MFMIFFVLFVKFYVPKTLQVPQIMSVDIGLEHLKELFKKKNRSLNQGKHLSLEQGDIDILDNPRVSDQQQLWVFGWFWARNFYNITLFRFFSMFFRNVLGILYICNNNKKLKKEIYFSVFPRI